MASDQVFRPRFGELYRSLIVSVALPLIAVQILLRNGTPAVTALAIAAVFPFVEAVAGLMRKRRFEPIAVLSLAVIAIGIGTAGITGNAGFAVAKESLFTIVFGVICLGSLAAPRPLIFKLGRQYATGGDATAMAAWDARWTAQPGFRYVLRLITAIWGCVFLLEAALRVVAAFTLPVTTSTIVSVALQVVALGGLILWTTRYSAYRRRLAAAA